MTQINNYMQWLHDIIRPDNLYLSIRDTARACQITDTQVRYWIKNGYLKTVKAENGAVKLPYKQIIHARMIKKFLDDGFTLHAAVKKAQDKISLARSLQTMLLDSMQNITVDNDQVIFDFGPLAEDEKRHVYGIEQQGKIHFTVQEP
ncbi:MerR family transcriptional regulator [Bombilactobacillus folatiphilus]|uniref:MerR family transcriptional regulator n=1 Tax=Bombilactobacillus folatiphilus TaxID=2923362 RepID=A0ABY4P9B8_9LACO|nr:MerR family transcriptional regulator [Bombilactobacillus folatiphilus]UQS82195.1 MerR family transcriptional regulator [Bombilactobacillus folatiphilus]